MQTVGTQPSIKECVKENEANGSSSLLATPTTKTEMKVTNSKVWTKLRNGHFGWRKIGIRGRRGRKTDSVQPRPPLVFAEPKRDPVEVGMLSENILNRKPALERNKRKYSEGGDEYSGGLESERFAGMENEETQTKKSK